LEKTIDILCIGEVLIDFIGHEVNTSINRTKDYHRFLGGSPTNVAVNASRLGLNSVLVATCGQDGLGDYIVRKLKANNVNTAHIRLRHLILFRTEKPIAKSFKVSCRTKSFKKPKFSIPHVLH
jgi:sugar/nucleoside kinase (ribokinase family)